MKLFRSRFFPGLIITLIFLSFGLATNREYGLFWDYYFHLNSGLKRLGLTPPFPSDLDDQPYGVLSSLPGAASYVLFTQKLNLLPPDQAMRLPFIFWGALGVFAIYITTLELIGKNEAIVATTLLAMFPRYIGHSITNPKDPLSAALICLSLYFSYKYFAHFIENSSSTNSQISLLKHFVKNWQSAICNLQLILAAIFAALAFNTKINAILIPPIILFWLLLLLPKLLPKLKFLILNFTFYISLLVAASLGLWFLTWDQPLYYLKYLFEFFSHATQGYHTLYFGYINLSNINTLWYVPISSILIITPSIVLLFFAIGLVKCISTIFTRSHQLSINNYQFATPFLLSWLLVPLLKYLNPNIGFPDDFRTVMEALYPYLIISSIGAVSISKTLTKLSIFNFQLSIRPTLLYICLVLYLFSQIAQLHPHEIDYFSDAIGGLPGAVNKFDVSLFGTAIRPAVEYLNRTAPRGSTVYIPLASVTALPYLRPDLRALLDFNTIKNGKLSIDANYVILLNRQGLFESYDQNIFTLLRRQAPVYTVSRQDIPLVYVFKNK